jgi:hypothetical protein
MLRKPLAIFTLLISACSSTPPVEEHSSRYILLDGESKALFLSLYPWLTLSQRESWLAGGMRVRRDSEAREDEIARLLSNVSEDRRKALQPKINAILDEPLKFRPSSLEIAAVQNGSTVTLMSTLVYADGTRVSVRPEDGIRYELQPALGTVRGDTVTFDCAATDVVIYAAFLNAQSTSQVLKPRKPLKELKISIDGAWQNLSSKQGNATGDLPFRAEAVCQDGTRSNVTCLANWSTRGGPSEPAKSPRFSGCGKLSGAAPGSKIQVSAKFADRIAESTITTP